MSETGEAHTPSHDHPPTQQKTGEAHTPSHDHLSIGQVLTLLADDHPNLTISKIRFLERQGLVSPERTPSGFRKFFPKDVERLRWVLAQQRDQYLPLKEIKRRLERTLNQPTRASAESESRSPPGIRAGTAAATIGAPPTRRENPKPAGAARKAPPRAQKTPPIAKPVRQEPRSPERGRATGPVPRLFKAHHNVHRTAHSLPGENSLRHPGDSSGKSASIDKAAANNASASTEKRSRLPASAETALRSPQPPTPRQPDAHAGSDESGTAELQEPRRKTPQSVRTPPNESSASLTASELAQAADVDAHIIFELQKMGLIIPTTPRQNAAGGEPEFGHDALAMLKTVSEFAARGVPARNLRMYRIAADREAGVYQQVVSTLIARGNKERVRKELDSLLDLSDTMRRSLLKHLLKSYLD